MRAKSYQRFYFNSIDIFFNMITTQQFENFYNQLNKEKRVEHKYDNHTLIRKKTSQTNLINF